MAQKDVSANKRQQIAKSSRIMFVWVAGASVLVGFAAVICWFLIQQIMFKERVITEKNKTVSTLQQNIKAVPKLSDNIRVLETNVALNSAKANSNEKALQVILDALPADENTLALGASLQTKLIGSAGNLTIDSLDATPAAGANGTATTTTTSDGVQRMNFSFTVSSADPNAIKDLLKRLERSVRIMDVDTLRIEQSETRMTMVVQAHAYYLPEKKIELKKILVGAHK